MATKQLSKKAKGLLRSDLILSVAIVSVLINLFFIVGIVVYSGTNELDSEVYQAARQSYCIDNYAENLAESVDRAETPAQGKAGFEIECRTGDFQRYFDNAAEAYLNDTL